MKIVVPSFVLSLLSSPTCDLIEGRRAAEMCDIVTVDAEGVLSGDPTDAEVVMLPWSLPEATVYQLLQLPSVKWVQTVTAGTEHALQALLPGQDIVITNASGVFDIPIAEMVLTYILTVSKRIPEFLAQQDAATWRLLRLREVAGLTVAVVGLGSIGSEVARRCKALQMRVLATRRNPDRGGASVDTVFAPDQLSEMLPHADFVVVCAPLTPETRGMIGSRELALMRSDAWLINIARGPLVDEQALIDALGAGRLGGAALDVFSTEPLPEDSPLWGLPNVIITPHNSWSTPHMKARETALFLENLDRYLRGEPLRNMVDPSRGY